MVMGKESWDEWIAQYAASHQNRVNRACHTFGIPMIAISLLLIPVAAWQHGWWPAVAVLFAAGWILQFVGHTFEGKPPEFFKDWRFLFVGLRWWFAKIAGRA
jgi:uncharacterized membrane protein YGL010W